MTHPDTGATTLGELRASGHVHRSVKSELRENLLARLRAGEDAFPGMVGFEETVLPELETALLAGHDLVLLGERGQARPASCAPSRGCSTSGARSSRAARSATTRTSRRACAAGG